MKKKIHHVRLVIICPLYNEMKAERINIKSETRRVAGRLRAASRLLGYLANCLDG